MPASPRDIKMALPEGGSPAGRDHTSTVRWHLEAIRDCTMLNNPESAQMFATSHAIAALELLKASPRASDLEYVRGVRDSDTAHVHDPRSTS